MLILKDIFKDYTGAGDTVRALQGVNIAFRQSEYVSVLGPSGCGKTTLLNIIGGLDQYTSGDLVINGRSTKDYKDYDWDAYRNHSVGFVFQSYNLIPHQTVLANVELALTLSGVSRLERRKRAEQVLNRVGLGDQMKKRPNQLSGGQMQRVAIARALVNDPDILLADEPTGALDTETSVQVLDILKEIAKDRLVIMVTHNPELAERYSTRIVRLLDGRIIGDTDPYDGLPESDRAAMTERKKRPSMSLKTAFSLSLNNLMTKKRRTLLTAFAGSIGIIGIALILSLSTGFQDYINGVESDTLSNYPITVEAQTVDLSSLMGTLMGMGKEDKVEHSMDKIYSSNIMFDMFNTMTSEVKSNDLAAFKKFLDSRDSELKQSVREIEYIYDLDLQVFSEDTSMGIIQVNPSNILDKITGTQGLTQTRGEMSSFGSSSFSQYNSFDVFSQLQGSQSMLDSQYEVISGSWPSAYDEVVLIVDKNNEISDMTLYTLGLLDQSELTGLMKRISSGERVSEEQHSYEYGDLLGLEFSLLLPTDYYQRNNDSDTWTDMRRDADYMANLIEDALKLKVVGILRSTEDRAGQYGTIAYTPALMQHYISAINNTEIVKSQLKDPGIDVISGKPFSDGEAPPEDVTIEEVYAYIESLPQEQQAEITPYLSSMTQEQIIQMYKSQLQPQTSESTYEDNLALLGVTDEAHPAIINLYPKDFKSKDSIEAVIESYNDRMRQEGKEDSVISYTDYVGMLMSNVTKIVNTISYVLIAFVAISLVVSSIMIGVITNISVLERTKEIGILRSIGASKRDISHVFNAETFIVGLAAGLFGVGITILLCIPINAIISSLTNIRNVASLEILPAVSLVTISVVLTLIAGLIPAGSAARKDPVEALRTE